MALITGVTGLLVTFLLICLSIHAPAADAILVRGPIAAPGFLYGRLTLSDAACGVLTVFTDESTMFSANGLALTAPNDVEVLIRSASNCATAALVPASRISVLAAKSVVAFPSQAGVVARLNMGGKAYTDPAGYNWAAETGYTGGLTSTITSAINATSKPVLYQSERYGLTALSISVPSKGSYVLSLHFVELFWSASGKRVFDIVAQNVSLVSGLDIYSRVGRLTPLVLKFTLSINSTHLDVKFVKKIDNPSISAVELTTAPITTPPTTVPQTTKATTPAPTTTKAATTSPPSTAAHPPGWLPVVTAADIAKMLADGSAVLWSSLQRPNDSVVVTTDAQGGIFRAYGPRVFQNIIDRCPPGKKIVFDTGTYEINTPGWDVGNAAACQVPKTCAGLIGREPPGSSWDNILPTTRRTTLRVKPNTAPQLNVAGSWFKAGFSGSVRFDWANLHFEGTEQGMQSPSNTGVKPGPGNDGTSHRLFTNVFVWTQADGNTARDCLSTGSFGNNGAPPGETFNWEWYHSTAGVNVRIHSDGRREKGGIIWTAAGHTFGECLRCVAIECSSHHVSQAGTTFFHTANCATYDSVYGDPIDNKTLHVNGPTRGSWVNHELTTGTKHYRITLNHWDTGRAMTPHVTHSGSQFILNRSGESWNTANGTLELIDPKWSKILFGGALTYQTWVPYGGQPSTIQQPPITRTAAGKKIPAKWSNGGPWLDI